MKVIGIHGPAGAGKSTLAGALVQDHGFVRVPFAGPLKAMAVAWGLEPWQVNDPAAKNAPLEWRMPEMTRDRAIRMLEALGLEFVALHFRANEPRRLLCNKTPTEAIAALMAFDRVYRNEFTTPRRVMQLLGTEWGRETIGQDLWIRAWNRAVDDARLEWLAETCDDEANFGVVADDVRFDDEADAVRALGGITVCIERPGLEPLPGAHASEAGGVRCDLLIVNDGTIDGLHQWADKLAGMKAVAPRSTTVEDVEQGDSFDFRPTAA